MNSAQNRLPGEAQTEGCVDRKLPIQPKKLATYMAPKPYGDSAAAKRLLGAAQEREESVVQVCEQQGGVFQGLPEAGRLRLRQPETSSRTTNFITCYAGPQSGGTSMFHSPTDLRRRVPERC